MFPVFFHPPGTAPPARSQESVVGSYTPTFQKPSSNITNFTRAQGHPRLPWAQRGIVAWHVGTVFRELHACTYLSIQPPLPPQNHFNICMYACGGSLLYIHTSSHVAITRLASSHPGRRREVAR